MRLDLDRLCDFCAADYSICNNYHNSENIANVIIYENEERTLFFNLICKKIFYIKRGKGLKELDFKETIRIIDTIPTEKPEWKRVQILKLAKELGFFGII